MQNSTVYHFGGFTVDVADRQLSFEGNRLDLNARYFDALTLMLREHGRLVEKDRFFDEVWNDVVVSDSALSQCIKEIRRQLGDDASNPRFIQTVPRHGYRFVADVSTGVHDGAALADNPAAIVPAPVVSAADRSTAPSASNPASVAETGASVLRFVGTSFSTALASALAGTVGGGVAGLLGGLLYGFGLAGSSGDAEIGTASLLLVLISLSGFLGTVGGFGIGAGVAAVENVAGSRAAWKIVGAAAGGMLIGGSVKLLGVDAFNLLFGRTPAGITGGMEGAALGFAIGLGARLGGGFEAPVWWHPVVAAAATGAATGILIAVSGGHLLGGSLDLLAQSFSDSRITLDALGRYFGEVRFGQTTQIVLSAIEGFIFCGCVVGAFVASRRSGRTE